MSPRRVATMPYKKSLLESAVKAVMAGSLSTKQAARVYGVSMASISTQLRRKGFSIRRKRGPVSLGQVDQQVLEWLQLMSEIGCYSLRNQLGDILREAFERLGLRDRLMSKMTPQQLTMKFLQRNPSVPGHFIDSKDPGIIITPEDLDTWLAKQEEHIRSTYNFEIADFLVESNAGNVFCCFEVGSVFQSAKNAYSRLIYRPKVEGTLMLSLYCCQSADGSFLKPVVIVKNTQVSKTTMDTENEECHLFYSRHGKMDCETAMLWMQLIDEEIDPKKNDKPLVIYLDQFIRPLSLATLDFCRHREIILYYLPGHYPSVRLPFGMDVFYNLNGEYDSILASDDAKFNGSSREITLGLLMDAWRQMVAANASTTEFHDFGILPLDLSAMKSLVETIVPITMTPSAEIADNSNAENSLTEPAAVPQTPTSQPDVSESCQRRVPPSHRSSSADTRAACRAGKSYKEASDSDERQQLSSQEEASSQSHSNLSDSKESVLNETNLKIKIRRSNATSNDFCVEPGTNGGNNSQLQENLPLPSNQASGTENSSSCKQCCSDRRKALNSGVVEGLFYALKRIEASLRADTLHLYKTRYLSPYLKDHRPTEPSFTMWCEIMKCLEMGPEAVHQDYIMSRNMRKFHPPMDSDKTLPSEQNPVPCVAPGLSKESGAKASRTLGQSGNCGNCDHHKSMTSQHNFDPVSVGDPSHSMMAPNSQKPNDVHASHATMQQYPRSVDANKNDENNNNLQLLSHEPSSYNGHELPSNVGFNSRIEVHSLSNRLNWASGIPSRSDRQNPQNFTHPSALPISYQVYDDHAAPVMVERQIMNPTGVPPVKTSDVNGVGDQRFSSGNEAAAFAQSQVLHQRGEESVVYDHAPGADARNIQRMKVQKFNVGLQGPQLEHQTSSQLVQFQQPQPNLQTTFLATQQSFYPEPTNHQLRFPNQPHASHFQEQVNYQQNTQHIQHQAAAKLYTEHLAATPSSTAFPTPSTPYNLTSTPKNIPMSHAGQLMNSALVADTYKTVPSLGATQPSDSSVHAGLTRASSDIHNRVSAANFNVDGSFRGSATKPHGGAAMFETSQLAGVAVDSKSSLLPMQYGMVPSTGVCAGQNSNVIATHRSIRTLYSQEPGPIRVETYNAASNAYPTLQQQQQSFASYQDYLNASASYSRVNLMPVAVPTSEQVSSASSYTNL
ncbi:uncharacterized protein LOC108671088 [Hyalella azteca]|uniref:Uncharacterized protein LOC108671088 n=1 Tax=Hyalella azteca TaxID=294128 RepID=A0A8B7NK77_HYAAZ|nr:uncharacterized protein LOC108671088 [Hyalella azteca]